jgi:hypothetical protein
MAYSFAKNSLLICALLGIGGYAFAGPCCNTATGDAALLSDTTGSYNTADGYHALIENTTGNYNTATGVYTLVYNNARGNTADGYEALLNNSSGIYNTASGYAALQSNTFGGFNTATGVNALTANITGSDNTAAGSNALASNTTGNENTAVGNKALNHNIGQDPTGAGGGNDNTAYGSNALYTNTTGNNNTASGNKALFDNTTGSNNIALGFQAGLHVTTGGSNIEIGNVGAASDNNMIKIGTEGTQAKTFIAGIYNTSVTGSAVMVNSAGQLGVVVSSERFKTAIASMGSNTEKLQQLRPVTFKLKTDAKGTRQYGLIAEEVAKVYPELVIRDEKGRIDSVRYDELAPMLLNEVQKQEGKIDAQTKTNADQAAEIRNLKQQVAKVNDLEHELAEMRTALTALQSKDQLVAQP